MTSPRRISDPETLKALAHPVRQRLFRLLGQLGPATVGQLAAKLESDPGRISYHLRELGKHGFIEEVPELAKDRRERWWQAKKGSASWSTADFDTIEGRAVVATLQTQMINDEFERLADFESDRDSWSPEWTEAVQHTRSQFRLTPAELAELGAELQNVFTSWSARHADRASDDPERQPVFVFLHAFPERP